MMCVLGYSPPANQWTSVAEKIAPPTPDVEDHTQALAQLRLVCLWAIHTSQLLVFFRQCHYVPEAWSESVIFLHGVFIHVSHHFCHKNGHLSILTLPTTHAEMGYHSAVSFLDVLLHNLFSLSRPCANCARVTTQISSYLCLYFLL